MNKHGRSPKLEALNIEMEKGYEELAKELNVSRTAIQKTEQRALRKCYKIFLKHGIKFDDFIE